MTIAALPCPDFELGQSVSAILKVGNDTKVLTKESHDPVHKLIPSLLTPKQLTRFSWPFNEPTLSPRRVSQTCESGQYQIE
jgi:hypothetical protein